MIGLVTCFATHGRVPAVGPPTATAPLVLVHSPLVGPLTWRAVADRFAGTSRPVAVPDLTGALRGPGPHQPRIAQAVAGAAGPLRHPVVLVGHSGAGPLLPGIAAALPVPVRALVYVDAGLPAPGRSWFQTAPAELVDQLGELAADGWLPPWHEWFPPAALAELLPDPRLRERFTAELSPLPLALFQEPAPDLDWPGPAGYLLLSETYRADAEQAAGLGAPVLERVSHHLAMLTSPGTVATALDELLTALPPPESG